MKYQIVFSGDNMHEMSNPVFWENKKNTSKCHLLKILTRVRSVKLGKKKTKKKKKNGSILLGKKFFLILLGSICCRNKLSHTIYWKSPISILGTPSYEIYIFLEKNG